MSVGVVERGEIARRSPLRIDALKWCTSSMSIYTRTHTGCAYCIIHALWIRYSCLMEHIAQSGPGVGGKRDDEGITKKPRIRRETSFVKRLDHGVER